MAKITPFGGVRITLFPGLSFTLRSSDIGKLLQTKARKQAARETRQLDLPGVLVPRERKR